MKKFKLYLFYIATFGIGYLIAKNKAKKDSSTINEELIESTHIPFKIDQLFKAIGGQTNYLSSSSTISSIRINVKDITIVQPTEIKKLGAKGTMLAEDSITCLFGDFSKELDKILKNQINK